MINRTVNGINLLMKKQPTISDLRWFQMFTSLLFQIKLVLSYSVVFKAPRELWKPPSKAVPVKYHGSGRHSKLNCLQDRANVHRSHACQIILILKTAIGIAKLCAMLNNDCIVNEIGDRIEQGFHQLYLLCVYIPYIFYGLLLCPTSLIYCHWRLQSKSFSLAG